MARSRKTKVKSKRQRQDAVLEKINLNAAGIDVGADKHFVAVPADRDAKPVRSFRVFTSELYSLCDWLKECQVDTVVMESTGVYWIALFQVLEERGFQVKLVNARHAKNLPGRKTDMLDCQWLQQLHTFGLLGGSFRPKDQICVLRSYLRQRDGMVKDCNSLVQRMQKALTQMNIQLHRVLSDITGVSGMKILRAIIAGERDTLKLARMKHPQVRSSAEDVARALEGDYRKEHLFALQTALELYDAYQLQIMECERRIEEHLGSFELKTPVAQDQPIAARSAEGRLHEQRRRRLTAITGADLTKLPGLDVLAVETIISEIGLEMNCWPSEKHFCSWLGVSPNNRISGGRVLPSKPRKNSNRAATALRMAAQSAMRSKTAVGAFIRRMKSRLGAPTAINAGAHKLARLLFRMLKFGESYIEAGQDYYETKYKDRLLRTLQKRAAHFGFQLSPLPSANAMVS